MNALRFVVVCLLLAGNALAADEKQRVAWEHDCGRGDGEACRKAGNLRIETDATRAAALYRSGCERGNVNCCGQLGWLEAEGNGVARDEKGGVKRLEAACNHGAATACSTLGYYYDHGRFVAQSSVRAVELFARSCNAHDPNDRNGCFNLGYAYLIGRGVKRDLAHAAQRIQQPCEQGLAVACTSLASIQIIDDAVHPERWPKFAVDLYRRGCAGGDQAGCNQLSQACKAGNEAACRALE